MPAKEDEEGRVAEILGRHGGFGMVHHGVLHWEALGSGPHGDQG